MGSQQSQQGAPQGYQGYQQQGPSGPQPYQQQGPSGPQGYNGGQQGYNGGQQGYGAPQSPFTRPQTLLQRVASVEKARESDAGTQKMLGVVLRDILKKLEEQDQKIEKLTGKVDELAKTVKSELSSFQVSQLDEPDFDE